MVKSLVHQSVAPNVRGSTKLYMKYKENLEINLINIVDYCGIWNGLHHGQTIHCTENFISLILFKIPSIVTWTWSFLTSEVMEAVIGQKSLKGWIFWKKVLDRVVQWQWPQKSLIRFELWSHMFKILDARFLNWVCFTAIAKNVLDQFLV